MTLTQYFSLKENFSYVNQAMDAADKQKRIAELKKQFEQSNFSSDAQPDFFAPEKAETALFDIKRLVVKHSVADSIKSYLTQRNDVIKRNRERQKEKEKLEQNPNVSHPFWY